MRIFCFSPLQLTMGQLFLFFRLYKMPLLRFRVGRGVGREGGWEGGGGGGGVGYPH